MQDRRKELIDELADVMEKATKDQSRAGSLSSEVTGAVFGWFTLKLAALEEQVAAFQAVTLAKQRKGKDK